MLCLSHMLHNAGKESRFIILDTFLGLLTAAVSNSYENQAMLAGKVPQHVQLWRQSPLPILKAPPGHRWFARFEFAQVLQQYVVCNRLDIVADYARLNKSLVNPTMMALCDMWKREKTAIEAELRSFLFFVAPLAQTCYALESDYIPPLVWESLDRVARMCLFVVKAAEHSRVNLGRKLKPTPDDGVDVDEYVTIVTNDVNAINSFEPVANYILERLPASICPSIETVKRAGKSVVRNELYHKTVELFKGAALFNVLDRNYCERHVVRSGHDLANLIVKFLEVDTLVCAVSPDDRAAITNEACALFASVLAVQDATRRAPAAATSISVEPDDELVVEAFAQPDYEDELDALFVDMQPNQEGAGAGGGEGGDATAQAATAEGGDGEVDMTAEIAEGDENDVQIDMVPRSQQARELRDWWLAHKDDYPRLCRLYRFVLLLQPSNGRIERVFSVLRAYAAPRANRAGRVHAMTSTMVLFNGRERARAVARGRQADLRFYVSSRRRSTLPKPRRSVKRRADDQGVPEML